jgi:hypothetical protein
VEHIDLFQRPQWRMDRHLPPLSVAVQDDPQVEHCAVCVLESNKPVPIEAQRG